MLIPALSLMLQSRRLNACGPPSSSSVLSTRLTYTKLHAPAWLQTLYPHRTKCPPKDSVHPPVPAAAAACPPAVRTTSIL